MLDIYYAHKFIILSDLINLQVK